MVILLCAKVWVSIGKTAKTHKLLKKTYFSLGMEIFLNRYGNTILL